MAKLLGLKFWVICAVYLTAGITLLQGCLQAFIHDHFAAWESGTRSIFTLGMTTTLVWLTLAFFLWKPIWTRIWTWPCIGAWLSNTVFPDLNGDWEIETRSNWSIISTMRNAAADTSSARLDVMNEKTTLPPLDMTKFPATIEQGWTKTTVIVDKNNKTPLRRSETIAVELIKEERGQPKRVAWIFCQENSPPAHTDEQNFLGAALLSVSKDGNTLEGKYWNNRSWHKGLNAAGEITMRRKSASVKKSSKRKRSQKPDLP